jgi:PRTRC genetic system protein E
MVTNFFQTLGSLKADIDWRISIARGSGEQLIVSVLPVNDKVGDDARKLIQPMLFKGTAAELDNGFFPSLQMPAQKISALFINMEGHLKSVEESKKRSKMEQQSNDKDKKNKEQHKEDAKVQKDEKKSLYEEQMKIVAGLEQEKKYKEAIDSLPKATDFPEYAGEINKKSLELLQKNISPGLF